MYAKWERPSDFVNLVGTSAVQFSVERDRVGARRWGQGSQKQEQKDVMLPARKAGAQSSSASKVRGIRLGKNPRPPESRLTEKPGKAESKSSCGCLIKACR